MMATVVWWELSRSEQTIDTLKEYLRAEGIAPWEAVRGLRLKLWISDRVGNRWGAVEVWDTLPATAALPPTRAAQLIGYPPTERLRFDVDAATEGVHDGSVWRGIGKSADGSATVA